VGYANNQLYTSTAGRTYTEYENGHGFDIAIPARYQFNPWFGAQAELAYIRKNYTLRRTGSFAEMYNEVSNGFIELPLMAHFSLGWENIRFFANTGAYFGFWTDSYRKGVTAEKTNDPWQPGTTYYYEYEEDAEFDDRRDARFDAGLLLGLGIQYAFKVCTIFLEGRYYYGVTDLQQNYQYDMVPRMNNTFSIRAGVLFNRNMFGLIRGKGK
jgi:hypothetical protein